MNLIIKDQYIHFSVKIICIHLLLSTVLITGHSEPVPGRECKCTVHINAGEDTTNNILTTMEKQAHLKFSCSTRTIDARKKTDLQSLGTTESMLHPPAVNKVVVPDPARQLLLLKSPPPISKGEALIKAATTVSGVVTDESGQPIPGVNVVEKGTPANGTTTDAEGKYTLVVAEQNAVLLFSFVGYVLKEVPVDSRSVIDIQLLSDQKQLDEVVVVGYGTEKRGSLTSSVATLNGSEVLKSSTTPNISNVFAGQVPGVIANNRSGRPGNDQSTISVRGANSFSGGTNPLYVIDGIPDRRIDRINPSDIESITVLKDASAAIYGVRSANGVILVTTKRGKSGKPEITYDGSVGLQQITRLDQRVNAWQYMTYFNEIAGYRGDPLQYPQADIDKYKAGDDPNYTSTDWFKSVFRQTAPQTNHTISVRGGTESVKFYVSGQTLTQRSLWANSDEWFKNLNVRSNLDALVSNNLKLTFDMAARREQRNYPVASESNILHETTGMYPFIPVRWSNGQPSGGVSNGRNPYLLTSSEPGYNNITEYFLQPKIGFEWQIPKITNGLFLSGWAAMDYNSRSQKIFTKTWDAYTYNRTTNTYSNQKSSTTIPSLTQDERTFNSDTYFLKIGYERDFGKHSLNTFIGYEQNLKKSRITSAYRKNLVSNKVDQLFAGSTTGQTAMGNATQDGRESYLWRFAYSYANRYLLEVTGRYNGSFNFPSNRRWGLFPAVSAAWRISDENFFKQSIKFVNSLKIRASWGIMGNDSIQQYQYLTRYGLVNGGLPTGYNYGFNTWQQYNSYFGPDYTESPNLFLVSTPNFDVTWEKQDTKDIGFDALLFNNKLSISFDYFRNYRTNILAQRNVSVPRYSGLTLPSENIGKSLNQGLDFMLTYSDKVYAFDYHTGFNFTYAKNTIIFQDEATGIPDYQRATGMPINSWVVYQTKGIYHNQTEVDNSPHLAGAGPGDLWIEDKNNDKAITLDDQVRIPASNIPQIVGGVTMGTGYKGFALDLVWAWQTKVKQLLLSQSQGSLVAPPQWLYDNRWTAGNPEAAMPRAFNSNDRRNNVYADFWLQDASFVRLKSVQLSYTFPPGYFSTIGVKSLRFYLSGFNLFSIDKMLKYRRDPETNNITGVNYPQTRIFRAGLTLGF